MATDDHVLLSPAEQRLESQVKALEAELEAEIEALKKDEETAHANQPATKGEDGATLSEDSSVEEDAGDVAASMEKHLAAEEEQMRCFVEQQSPKRVSRLAPTNNLPTPPASPLNGVANPRVPPTEKAEVSPTLPPFTPIRRKDNADIGSFGTIQSPNAPPIAAEDLNYSTDTNKLDDSNASSNGGGLEERHSPPDEEILQSNDELRPDGGKRPASQENLLEEGLQPDQGKQTARRGRHFEKAAILCLGTCFALMWRCLGACAISCWASISLLARNIGEIVTEAWHSMANRVKECLGYHRLMISLAPGAVQFSASLATKTERGVFFCFASLIVFMWTEVYPTGPSNWFVAILMLFFHVQPGQWKESKYHSMLLIVAVMVSICIDIDWLSYKYFPEALDGEDMAYRIQQESSIVWRFAWYAVMLNIVLKFLCLNSALKASGPGRTIRRKISERAGKCFVSTRRPDDLSAAVKDKAIAIAWIESLCSLLCFGCFFAIQFDIVSARAILSDVPLQLLSLKGTLLLKATSSFLVFLSWLNHICVKDLLGLCACRSVCPGLREVRGGRDRILSKVAKSLTCNIATKLLDFVLGVLVWIGLVSAHSQAGFDAPHDVTTLLGLVFAAQVLSTVYSPILVGAILWYVRVSKQRRLPSMEENTPISSRRAKKKNRRPRQETGSDWTSRNPTTLRTDVLEVTPDRGNYNLSEPASSQKMLETRLSIASSRATTPSSELDRDAAFDPRQFQTEWLSLQNKGSILSHGCQEVPSLSDCHKHFSSARFFVVGSGVVGKETRLLVVAQRAGQLGRTPSRCLAEITFNASTYEMKAEIRCRNHDEVRFFLSAMKLREIFGELL
ncbi:hypothetical protein ACHAXT_012045 [Thalassiosira profunda]